MNILLKTGLSALAFAAFAMPASATSVIGARCGVDTGAGVTLATGCAFTGNDDNVPAIISAYAAVDRNDGPIDDLALFSPVSKIEIPDAVQAPGGVVELMGFGKVTLDAGGQTGTWELFGGRLASYISAKGGNEFNLWKLAAPASSGTWSTLNLQAGQGSPALSHLQFYDGGMAPGIPEPATWAMLIAGFGMVGSAMRRRRATVAHVAA